MIALPNHKVAGVDRIRNEILKGMDLGTLGTRTGPSRTLAWKRRGLSPSTNRPPTDQLPSPAVHSRICWKSLCLLAYDIAGWRITINCPTANRSSARPAQLLTLSSDLSSMLIWCASNDGLRSGRAWL